MLNCQLLLLLLLLLCSSSSSSRPGGGSGETRKLQMKGSAGQYPYDFLFIPAGMCCLATTHTNTYIRAYVIEFWPHSSLSKAADASSAMDYYTTLHYPNYNYRCMDWCIDVLVALLFSFFRFSVFLADLVLLSCCFCVSSDDVASNR